ncbi:hypothetical protein, partial [Sphingobacterium spiritivorum]
MKIRLLVLLLSWVCVAQGQEANHGCPFIKNNIELCNDVTSQQDDIDSNSEFNYKFERTLYELSFINLNDDIKSKKLKLQKFWNKNKELLTCDRLDFNVPNGHILKLAVY